MRGSLLVAVLMGAAQASSLAANVPCFAEDRPATAAAEVPALGSEQTAFNAAPAQTADPVVALIRAKLGSPEIAKGADGDDLAALRSFYAARQGAPLWMTEMGLSARGQAALFEIQNADDWGLDKSAFDLPAAEALPKDAEAEALAEIKLDLAILKYARFARGGRVVPSEVSELYDQTPPLREPGVVLTEISAAQAPEAYLRSLHPQHEQFALLREALLKARGKDGAKPASDKDIKRLILNMERWRWMPEDLGEVYVMENPPEFMLYVVKDGKRIYADKTLVGTIGYATPVFSADMQTVVFNPDWVAPETVVTENLLPPLRQRNYSILAVHKLSVSYQGKPVDPSRVNWSRGNILSYTFTQKPGPQNVLGKIKFLYPNRHTVYMHDTLPVRKKYFAKATRAIGHECVRMERPQAFAEVVLAESNGMSKKDVKDLWDKGVNSAVTLEHKVPVHSTYFTAVVDDKGKVTTFADLYGLDSKLAAALFKDAKGFPMPPAEKKQVQEANADSGNRGGGVSGIARAFQSFVGD